MRLSRRFIAAAIFACLVLAVIAANLIYAHETGRGHLLAGGPGELLYASDFSGFLDEWELFTGQQSARALEERLELQVSAPQTATWSLARHQFADFDLTVSTVAIDGPIDNAFGVVFRARDASDGACDLPAVIFCGAEQLLPLAGAAIRQALAPPDTTGYFAFLISSDGYYSLRKTEAGATKLLSAWIASPHINQGLGAANTIRAVARGASYRFFINGAGAPLCIPDDASATSTYVDGECVGGGMQDVFFADAPTSGKLGLIAQSTATGGGGVVVRFDNLLVFSPAGPGGEDVKL